MQPDLRETSWSHGAVARALPKRRRTWRKLMVGGLLAASVSLVAVAAPAYAINDPRVPANECSPDNSAAEGDPMDPGTPGIKCPRLCPATTLECRLEHWDSRIRTPSGPAPTHCPNF